MMNKQTLYLKNESHILAQFNKLIIKEAKSLKAFKLELDDLIKHCVAVTTSPPDLLEHIAMGSPSPLEESGRNGLYPNRFMAIGKY